MFLSLKFVAKRSMFRWKKNNRLIISCPTWHIDQNIQEQTRDNCYFMNILAGIYIDDDLFMDQLIHTIYHNGIEKLSLIANPNCSFLKNILNPKRDLETKAEEIMAKIYHKKFESIQSIDQQEDQRKLLAYYCAQFSVGRILLDPAFQSMEEHLKPETSILTYGKKNTIV